MPGFRLWNNYKVYDLKILKVLPWQQLLPGTPQNLISSRSSWGKHTLNIFRLQKTLKILEQALQAFRLSDSHKFMPPAAQTAQGTIITPTFMDWR